MSFFRRSLCMAAAFALSFAGRAPALTLADLDAGGSFAVGPLTFADFEIDASGDISLDLADYPVQILADGFRISGPLSVLLGDAGTLLFSYTVSASDPIVYGASLFAPGTTIGAGAQAWVGESLLDGASLPLASLFAFDVEGVGSDPSDAASFATVDTVQVVKTVHVGSGLFAALPLVDQRFLFVPEPLTLVLLTLGLGGLALWGRRHGTLAPTGRS
jgi:hypothetical protein